MSIFKKSSQPTSLSALSTEKPPDVPERDGRHIYVIDTNIVVDYVDIIPGENSRPPEEPTVDLTGAHLVIPTAVVRELSSFKKENSDRGKAARVALRRIRTLTEGRVNTMHDTYNLKAPIVTNSDGQLISILPVHKHFKNALPFAPDEGDMDGQIILATLVVMALEEGCSIDGTRCFEIEKLHCNNVTLLTNDNGLAIRARQRGVVTSRYGYKYPEPYTGRRDLVVPKDVFDEFYREKRLDRDIWEEFMPMEQPLVANEFVVMRLENTRDYPEDFNPNNNPLFRHIGRYDATDDQIVGLKYVADPPFQILNDGQAMYAEALLNPQFSAVICTGPAGSGKTYLPTSYGIDACKKGKFIDVVVVPCADYGTLGALPGGLNEKMILSVGPARNAIRNYLLENNSACRRQWRKVQHNGVTVEYEAEASRTDCNSEPDGKPKEPAKSEQLLNENLNERIELIWQSFFRNIPVENARGLDFSRELILYDEFQDQNTSQADMLIKRIGKGGKMVITGDIRQIHAPYLDENNNGLVYAIRELYDLSIVARVSLLEHEVERHELVRAVAERQAARKKQKK